jgi:hypothetical protein
MKTVESAEEIVEELEEYLREISDALPTPSRGSDLASYISSILKSKSARYSMLRRALGFPSNQQRAKVLVHILKSSEPSLAPFVRLMAQRVYQLTWRFMYTLHWIEKTWKPAALNKARELLALCEPHLLARRPTPADLRPVLDWGIDSGMFRESVVDTQLFAVLRAFEYRNEFTEEENQPVIPVNELRQLRDKARSFLYNELVRALHNKQKVADSSNLWWALRVGLGEEDERFASLLSDFMGRFHRPIYPTQELASQDFAPDIRSELRTLAYTLSNAGPFMKVGLESANR